MWLKLLFVFIFLFVYKLMNCISDLVRLLHYQKLYLQYINNKNDKFIECSKLCVDLFEKLGLKEFVTNMSYPLFVFQNITYKTSEIISKIKEKFIEAIGIAKYNLKQCFCPLYWINFILFLPKQILIYLNVPTDSIFIRIGQILYWIIGFLVTIFSSDIANFIKSFIHFS